MKTIKNLLILALGCWSTFLQAQLSNTVEIKIEQAYAEISPMAKYRYDSLSYEAARSQTDYIYESFKYKSDNYEVKGLSCRPKAQDQKFPVIIYNRGGTGNFGSLSKEDLPDFYTLAKKGFAVFASDYRFVGKLGSMDQIGGEDVNDVINLYEALKSVDYLDHDNIFMMGVSRGGQMTYQSLCKINVNAAAVIGGVADFKFQTKERPIFLSGWDDLSEEMNYQGLENILPDFEHKKEEYLAERSATNWADEINTPLYILHSRQDGRVKLSQVIKLIALLDEFQKEYKVKIYDQKSHSLPYSKFDSFEEICSWFKAHLK